MLILLYELHIVYLIVNEVQAREFRVEASQIVDLLRQIRPELRLYFFVEQFCKIYILKPNVILNFLATHVAAESLLRVLIEQLV